MLRVSWRDFSMLFPVLRSITVSITSIAVLWTITCQAQHTVSRSIHYDKYLAAEKKVVETKDVPSPMSINRVLVSIKTQQDFDNLQTTLDAALNSGSDDICVVFGQGLFFFKDDHILLNCISKKNISLHLQGNNTLIVSSGRAYNQGDIYHGGFSTNNVYLDSNLHDLFIWGQMYQSDRMVEVLDEKTKLCRIHSPEFNLPSDSVGPNSWIQLTEWFMSGTYKVERIDGQDVYFTASDLKPGLPAYGNYNVNYDYTVVKLFPRFRVCNLGDKESEVELQPGITVSRSFYECQSSTFLKIYGSDLRSLEISGLDFYGNSGKSMLFRLLGARTTDGIYIHDCGFHGIKSIAVYMMGTSNTHISHCRFEDCYDNVLLAISQVKNTQVTDNYFFNVGKGLESTFAIRCQSEGFYVARNTVVNFGLGGIAVGKGGSEDGESSGIVEDNIVYFTDDYAEYARKNSLIDGGAIYIWPKNNGTIVRYNRIHNYTGAHSNRGIYCDNGAYGFSLYGNIITGISNSNYIDSRRVSSKTLPTNTKNLVMYNIIEGRYLFEGSKSDNECFKGLNIVLNHVGGSPYRIVLNSIDDAEDDVFLDYIANQDLTIVVPRNTRRELRRLPFYDRIKEYIQVR